MNISINSLHKAFESRIRLGIMSALAVNDMLDFNSLKEFLDVTDGPGKPYKRIGKRKVYWGKKIIRWQKAKHQIFHDEER